MNKRIPLINCYYCEELIVHIQEVGWRAVCPSCLEKENL
jgi:formylmethanofuran dehydrogenase subunit E